MQGMEEIPSCITEHKLSSQWLGNSIHWMLIEIIVFANYTSTLLILMFKSRFDTIGMDQSGQFEPYYLQRMINHIISRIPFEKFRNKNKFVKFWQDNEENIDVIGTKIRIILSKEDCEDLYDKWYLNDMPYITKEESNEWITTRLVGSITKYKLDV